MFIMEINDFVGKFATQFDDTDASELKPETIYRNLVEWSSLKALFIIAMVDEEYKVELKGDDIQNSQTIEDIFNIVKSRL